MRPMLAPGKTGFRGNGGGFGGAPARAYTTFDPLKKGANVSLSNGNLTASGNNNSAAFSVLGVSSGKWYWEFSPANVFSSLGISLSDPGFESYIGESSQAWGYRGASTSIMNGNSFIQAGLASYTAGDIISIALNLVDNEITWRKNNVVQGVTQAIAAGQTWYAAASGINSGGGWGCTANFGASAFVYTPPAGFNAGLYE